jgi:aspartate/methionine/tyrosine aminotransferase
VPKGAFYAFPNITATGWDERSLASSLMEEGGVATIAGTDFGGHGAGFIRLSCANSLENIAAAIERIENFLGEHEPEHTH